MAWLRVVSHSPAGRKVLGFNHCARQDDYVEAGGPDGPDFSGLFRTAAEYVDKMRGTRPGDLPIEQPTKFQLAINLKRAKAIGRTIPESFLLRAHKVIE
jgi:putative ABC transport system substrate-binding protein